MCNRNCLYIEQGFFPKELLICRNLRYRTHTEYTSSLYKVIDQNQLIDRKYKNWNR